jgi:hypothetical protein
MDARAPKDTMKATTVGTESVRSGGAHSGGPGKNVPDPLRMQALEVDNARLLRLVGELLVVNQQLREQNAVALHREEESR